MIVVAMLFLSIFVVYMIAYVILVGILHIDYRIERDMDEKELKHDRYKKLFKYLDSL